jgi:hypothetical protein
MASTRLDLPEPFEPMMRLNRESKGRIIWLCVTFEVFKDHLFDGQAGDLSVVSMWHQRSAHSKMSSRLVLQDVAQWSCETSDALHVTCHVSDIGACRLGLLLLSISSVDSYSIVN